MRKQDTLPANWESGIAIGAVVAVVVFISCAWLLWKIPYPYQLAEFSDHLKLWAALRFHDWLPFLNESAQHYASYLANIESRTSSWLFTGRFDLALVTGVITGAVTCFLIAKPESATRHIAGRRLFKGIVAKRLLRSRSQKESGKSTAGLKMHPQFDWHLSEQREAQHTLIMGSVGSGKTVILNPMIRAAIERNDRVVIYDNKGDFTKWLPDHVLIAPWDSRSKAWHVAGDCRNEQDARQLAARLILPSSDPIWSQAARQLLTAILIKLQKEHGTDWGWQELYKLACSSMDDLLSIVSEYLPEAVHLVQAPGKTTQSVLINFGANISMIADLAKAWGDAKSEDRFSIVDWLKNSKTPQRILVLQGSGRYAELAKSYIQGIIAMASGLINSAEFIESDRRRVWFFFDEFPQLGKLDEVAPLLEIGRSKGIRVVLTAQDLHQIKDIYGDNLASTWISIVGTQIIAKVNAGETANYVAKEIIGYQKIDRVSFHENKRQAPVREDVLVIEPSELQSELGRDQNGINAILLGFEDAFLLHWPFTETKSLRPSSVRAAWLQHTFSDSGDEVKVQQLNSNERGFSAPLQNPSVKPRLALRPLTDLDAWEMAETGTAISDAADRGSE